MLKGIAVLLSFLCAFGLVACDRSVSQSVDSESQQQENASSQSVVSTKRDLSGGDRFSAPGVIAHTPQRPGNPALGRTALLEKDYVSCGLPERVFRQILGDEVVIGIEGRTEQARGLPFFTNVTTNELGVATVSNNCLTCHGTELFGELVVGLGNEFLDFTSSASALVERAGLLVQGEAETQSWQKYADRISAIAPYTRMHTVGVNPANNLTLALMAHRDPLTQAWSVIPLMDMPPQNPPPVSVPPWWRMSKKPAMFSMGEGRGDHARIMMAASMMCTDDRAALDEIDTYAPDIRAFIASLSPPKWPFPVQQALALKGQQVFERTCSGCHGTYGNNPSYPGLLVPLEVIQTDSLLVDYAMEGGVPFIDWFNQSYYGELSRAAPGKGYVAPPLDGVWATAPFLHNGSVPDIQALLNSKSRPQIWRHRAQNSSDKRFFNQKDVGWLVDRLSEDDVPERKPKEIYDTRKSGYGNSGHTFGDHLTEDERLAVIEYLKTL